MCVTRVTWLYVCDTIDQGQVAHKYLDTFKIVFYFIFNIIYLYVNKYFLYQHGEQIKV